MIALWGNTGTARRLKILRRPKESIRPSTPRPERQDCHGRLCAALLEITGDGATVDGDIRPWHSATFVGMQHRLTLALQGTDTSARADALAASLPEAEFAIRGHIVVDLAVDCIVHDGPNLSRLSLCVLTLEDW